MHNEIKYKNNNRKIFIEKWLNHSATIKRMKIKINYYDCNRKPKN